MEKKMLKEIDKKIKKDAGEHKNKVYANVKHSSFVLKNFLPTIILIVLNDKFNSKMLFYCLIFIFLIFAFYMTYKDLERVSINKKRGDE